MEIKLQHPFTTAAGQKVESLTLRRLKVKDLKQIGEQSAGNEVQLELLGVGRMCGLVIEDLEEMDAADYQRLKARFLEYLGVAGQPVVGNGAAGEVVSVSAERD